MRNWTLTYLAAAVAVFVLALLAPAAYAAGEGRALSLDECVRTALEHNRALLSRYEKVGAAHASVGMAASGFLPKITLSETYMRSDNPVMSFGAKINQGRFTQADLGTVNNPSAIDNFNFRAEVVQPLFNGGRELVGYSRAILGLESAGKGLERARQETAFEAVRGYYGVLLAGEYVKVADKALETTQAHVKEAQDFYNQGMLAGSEVLLAKVRLAEVKEMRIKAINQEKTAKAGLNLLMGRDQDTPFEVEEPSVNPGEPGVLADYLNEAAGRRPDLAGMELDVRNMEKGVTMARTGYLPNLNLIGRYEFDDKDLFGSRRESYTLMGMLTWNIFDGFYTTKSVSEARANYNAVSHMRDQMKEGVGFEVRQAYYKLVDARARTGVTGEAVTEGEEALRIIRRRFDAGMTRTLDVLDAETALTRARTNKAEADYDANVAMAELMLATGRMEYR
ncbi:MAG TPA: TolC family protein [Nitrospirota bacterium]